MIVQKVRFGSALCAALFVAPLVSGSDLRTPVLSGRDAPVAAETLAEPSARVLFQRIVVLGASVSAGFVISEPLGGPKTPQYRLAQYLDSALTSPHEKITTHANSFLFLKPEETMRKQLATVQARKPTLVVALDALFWFCYGEKLTEKKREELFERGLDLLAQIDAPIVVGDIPDASAAVGKLLNQAQMPALATIARCNERLNAWKLSRKNVAIFPLNRVMAKASANEELSVSGMTWAAGKTRALLQTDGLHPSRHGLAAIAIATLETAAAAAGSPGTDIGVLRDLELVYKEAIARSGQRPTEGTPAGATPPAE